MALITQFPLGSRVNFEVYASSVLGNSFKNLKVLGLIDADSARFFGADAAATHANIFSELPGGTENDYRKYYYVRFETQNGSTLILGLPWIVESSVEVIASNTAKVTIPNIGPDDVILIRQALAANGYNGVTVELQ